MLRRTLPTIALAIATFLSCLFVAALLHEPIPRVHDEFSYLLMADTLAHGHVTNPSPPHSEFFDTFHVLIHPVYASKYFPAQGFFLAIGEKLTGHPAVGVWLSSALACGATYWMLEAWIGPGWALFGAVLMLLQFGIYGYWSQTYWGGMVAALGGALSFGAGRRLWDVFSWGASCWFACGVAILINSRPLEGFLALLPFTVIFLLRFVREKVWFKRMFWMEFVLPTIVILGTCSFLTFSYNRSITGSIWKPPYLLHEQQYQQTPQFTFLPLRPKINYSSAWVQYYYEHWEMNRYERQRDPKLLITDSASKIVSWWYFFCGLLLSPCLVLPGLLKGGRICYLQAAIAIGLGSLWAASGPTSFVLLGFFDLLVAAQIIVLWYVFDNLWTRLALLSCSLVLLETLLVKWFFPHYVAPAACLILYLQIDGARRIWEWKRTKSIGRILSRKQRRRRIQESASGIWLTNMTRGYVYILPVLCALSLGLRIEGRINDWDSNEFNTDNLVLRKNDWSVHRAELEQWLNEQPEPQLVFVAYAGHHNVNFEWVYNHADITHSHVIWARNLGPDHNRLLLQDFPGRKVWLIEADRREPQLIPYSEFDRSAAVFSEKTKGLEDQRKLNW